MVDVTIKQLEQITEEVEFDVVDMILVEMHCRFDVKNMKIVKAIQALIPCSENFLNPDIIEPLASHYLLDMEKLKDELPLAGKVICEGIE